jgi:hypothetical protein
VRTIGILLTSSYRYHTPELGISIGRNHGTTDGPSVVTLSAVHAKQAGQKGIQEWLSFYFKSPQTAPGLYPEHDLFIQQTKLKNTLRSWMGEDLITHLGSEYYEE